MDQRWLYIGGSAEAEGDPDGGSGLVCPLLGPAGYDLAIASRAYHVDNGTLDDYEYQYEPVPGEWTFSVGSGDDCWKKVTVRLVVTAWANDDANASAQGFAGLISGGTTLFYDAPGSPNPPSAFIGAYAYGVGTYEAVGYFRGQTDLNDGGVGQFQLLLSTGGGPGYLGCDATMHGEFLVEDV